VSSGLSTRRSVALAAPGCLPGAFPERVRDERLSAGFLVNGESDDGGFPLLEESRPSWARNPATTPSNSVRRARRTTFSSRKATISASLAANSDAMSPHATSGPDPMIEQ
jgi:hypothetical protein